MAILVLLPNTGYTDQLIIAVHSIEQVNASRNLPSHCPIAVQSGSGRIHILFLHENQIGETILVFHHYHTFQLKGGGWSVPQKFENRSMTIYDIKPNISGFTIYFSIEGRELYKRSYDEEGENWLTPVSLFGGNYISEYLGTPGYRWWIKQYCLVANDTLMSLWCFEDPTGIHKQENCYFLSRINTSGSIVTHCLNWTCSPYYGDFHAVSSQGVIFLYRGLLADRSVHYPNGTWTGWQSSGFDEFQTWYRYPATHKSTILDYRYFIGQTRHRDINQGTTPFWVKVDLTADNLTMETVDIPLDEYVCKMDFESKSSTSGEPVYITALVRNHTIELWNVNFWNGKCDIISSVNYQRNRSLWESDVFNIDLLHHGSHWSVFWDQKTHTDPGISSGTWEIFTITYDAVNSEWTPVTQVTDTDTISDDYTWSIPGFTFSVTFLGLILVVNLLCRKRRRFLTTRHPNI
ncbi:MAG: hypothetical protein ACFFC6_18235 [Promethearchaeota archaeon]